MGFLNSYQPVLPPLLCNKAEHTSSCAAPAVHGMLAVELTWLKLTRRRHHLSTLQCHLCGYWKAERDNCKAKHCGKKLSLFWQYSIETIFTGSCIIFLKIVNSEAKYGYFLGLLQTCINQKTLNLLLSNFYQFLFQGSGGTEIPMDNCTIQTAVVIYGEEL